ncbi:hypothetical protein H8D85_01325 [bacterium]|nr:hypothetical protein [bacterium]
MIKGILGNMVLIELEKETEDSHVMSNGVEIFIDTALERMWHARQYGTVKHISPKLHKRVEDNIKLKKGDKVYFHHFVIDSPLELEGEKLYKADINQIYAIDKGDSIQMLQDYILVEPSTNEDELVTKSGIITGKKEWIGNQGVVKYINQFTEKVIDLHIGDKIVFQKNANYKIKVQGEDLYRMRDYDALCVIGR